MWVFPLKMVIFPLNMGNFESHQMPNANLGPSESKFRSKALPRVFSKLGAHLHHLARPVSPSCKEPEASNGQDHPGSPAKSPALSGIYHIMTIQKPSWDDEMMNQMMNKNDETCEDLP